MARSAARGSLLRHLNEREVLAAIQAAGPLSRADITRRTGISGPTVTRTVAALLRARLLEEGDARPRTLGRPGRVLRLACKTAAVLGLVVGARRCELVTAGLNGEIDPEHAASFETPPGYAELVRAVVRESRLLIDRIGLAVLGLGVSMPGLLNKREKRTLFSPNLHQTDGRRLGDDLHKNLRIETAILQESHALCLAEQNYGAARGVADFAMLDISEGLGVGVVSGGRVLEGCSGLGGELGHVTVDIHGKACGCGNRGCLETVASDTALAAAVSERVGRRIPIEEVVELLRSGQVWADDELHRILEYLAVGMAAVVNLFNPSKLYLYGRLLDARDGLFDELLQRTGRRALAPSMADCDIIRARGSKRLGAVAAIIHRLTTGRDGALE
ncbi:MAG TPA: ROK family transcriptional regulator [Gemmataceae bacterium]|nr:ROK family transcriptional regulator [Gemmataceae bacterium]